MKLPLRTLDFIDEQNRHDITNLDQLVDAWLLANETKKAVADQCPAVEIAMELPMAAANREFLWLFIRQLTQSATTKYQLGMIAAGPLEDLISSADPAYIDKIEILARKSKRFRYLLTGVWPQGRRDSIAWQRIETARAAIMQSGIDSDADIPAADLPVAEN